MAGEHTHVKTSTPWPALIVLGEHGGAPPVSLARQATLVGSRHSAHIRLNSSQVSRAHALIINSENSVYLRDLNSRTHCFVNGQQTTEAELQDGDLLKIGEFTFRFSSGPKELRRWRRRQPSPMRLLVGGKAIALEQRAVVIGRREGCDLQLPDDSVSTTHAVIFEATGRHFIRDLGSRNGTFVNDEKVEQVALDLGETIRIGPYELRCEMAGAAVQAAEHAPEAAVTKPANEDLDVNELLGIETPPAFRMPRPTPHPQPQPLAVEPPAASEPPEPPAEPAQPEAPDSDELAQVQENATAGEPVETSREMEPLDLLNEAPAASQAQTDGDEPVDRAGETDTLPAADEERVEKTPADAEPAAKSAEAESLADAELQSAASDDDDLDLPPLPLESDTQATEPFEEELAEASDERTPGEPAVAPADEAIAPETPEPVDESPIPLNDEPPAQSTQSEEDLALELLTSEAPQQPDEQRPKDSTEEPPARDSGEEFTAQSEPSSPSAAEPQSTEKPADPGPPIGERTVDLTGGESSCQPPQAPAQLPEDPPQPQADYRVIFTVLRPEEDAGLSTTSVNAPLTFGAAPPAAVEQEQALPAEPADELFEESQAAATPADSQQKLPPVDDEDSSEITVDTLPLPDAAHDRGDVQPPPASVRVHRRWGDDPLFREGQPDTEKLIRELLETEQFNPAAHREPEPPTEDVAGPAVEIVAEPPAKQTPATSMEQVSQKSVQAAAAEQVQAEAASPAQAADEVAPADDNADDLELSSTDVFSIGHTYEAQRAGMVAVREPPPQPVQPNVVRGSRTPPTNPADDEFIHIAPAPAGGRLLLLLMLMLAAMVIGALAVWKLVLPHVLVESSISFQNFAELGQSEQDAFGQRIVAALYDDRVRSAAAADLRSVSPQASAGFLSDDAALLKQLSSRWESREGRGQLLLTLRGRDPTFDASRLESLVRALYQSPECQRQLQLSAMLAEDLRPHQTALSQASAELESLLARKQTLQKIGDQRPELRQIEELRNTVRTLEETWLGSIVARKGQSAELDSMLRAGAPLMRELDPQVAELKRQMDAVAQQIQSARSVQADASRQARRELDESVRQLNAALVDAERAMQDNPELRRYVSAAQGFSDAARKMQQNLIDRQQSQQQRLQQYRQHLQHQLAEQRRKAIESDADLRELTALLDLKRRERNEAEASGIAREVARLDREIEYINQRIAERREALKGDGFYDEAIAQIEQIIASSQQQIAADRTDSEQLLKELESSFRGNAPQAANLSEAQRAMVAALADRVAAMQQAQRACLSADEDQDETVARLKAQAAGLQQKLATRQSELSAATAQALGSDQQARFQHQREQLAQAERDERQAQQAYREKLRELEHMTELDRAYRQSREELAKIIDQQEPELRRAVASAQRRLDAAQKRAAGAVFPLEPSAARIVEVQDNRAIYTVGVVLAIGAVFAGIIPLSLRRSRSFASPPPLFSEPQQHNDKIEPPAAAA